MRFGSEASTRFGLGGLCSRPGRFNFVSIGFSILCRIRRMLFIDGLLIVSIVGLLAGLFDISMIVCKSDHSVILAYINCYC